LSYAKRTVACQNPHRRLHGWAYGASAHVRRLGRDARAKDFGEFGNSRWSELEAACRGTDAPASEG